MTPTQESIDYWRTRALAAEQSLLDMENMGVILPHDYKALIERIREQDNATPLELLDRSAATVVRGLVV